MKKPKVERFVSEEQRQRIKPENIDFSGVPPIKKLKKGALSKKVVKEKQKDIPSKAYGRTDSTGVRTDVLSQIPQTPEKRRPERYAFQFWADQITRLKKLKQVLNLSKDPEDRDETSLSDMVRQAIDAYLDKQIKQISKTVRSDK